MKLDDYLRSNRITASEFARRIGASFQAVDRYRKNQRIPCRTLMRRIVEATEGHVMPNDFFDLPNPPPAPNDS